MPHVRPLPYKPLVEAILEFRWQISEQEGDQNYPLFVGRLYDRVQTVYPFHEPLPSAMIPVPIAPSIVQHRFRLQKEGWPLVQVGPGIVTVNDTDKYSWIDFGERAKSVVEAIYDAYPQPEKMRIASLVLKYLDAFELASDEDALACLSGKLKTMLAFPAGLFQDNLVSPRPKDLNILASFPTSRPKGSILVRFATGIYKEKPALIMETSVASDRGDLPKMPDGFKDWAEAGHVLTDQWFFTFIEGELERRFAGE